MVDNRNNDIAGRDLDAPIKVQLQVLVNKRVVAQSVKNALVAKVNTDKRNTLSDAWNTSFKHQFRTYSGGVFTKPIPIASKGSFRINHLLIEKNKEFPELSANARVQLQTLISAGISFQRGNKDIETSLGIANTANNTALNNLWTALKQSISLGGYTGFNPGDTDITVDGNPYKLHLLITSVRDSDLDSTDGSDLTDAQGKLQLQALVNGGITNANAVRTALDTADNNKKLDDLWTTLKAVLTGYTGFNFENIDVEVDGNNYRLNLLIDNKADPLSGSTLTTAKGQVQLQDLVNGGITDANAVRTALDTANNTALNNLWTALKAVLTGYTGFNFENIDVEVDGNNYRLNLLIDNKADPLSGSTLTTAKGQVQLQDLVNGGITDANAVRTALDTANNTALNNLWTALKAALTGYTGFNFEDVDVNVDGNNYRLNLLIDNKADPLTGSTLTTAKVQAQLQDLVNGGITDANAVRTALDTANNTALNNLWTALKEESNLGGYTGFNPGDTNITVDGNPYKLHLLITSVRDQTLASTAGRALTTQQGKLQLQKLVNAGITASQVRSTLNTANNQKLDDLWTEILDSFNKRGGSFAGNQITIKDKSYPFKEIAYAASVMLPNNPSGSSLAVDIKNELQTLVSAGVTVKDIETYLDSLKKQAEEVKEEKSTKNQNLAIGLGTAGGAVVLAGAGGFAYWFLKIRKS